MQEQNFKSVVRTFETILEHDSITRGDIAEIIGCSVVTVCKAVELLLKNNLVTEEKEQFCGPGRKAKALRVCVHAHTILILDITKRCFQARLLYLDCKADQDTFEYEPQEEISFRGALHDFFEKCCQIFEQARPQNDSCIGIGVVVPGPYFEPEDRVVNKRFPELENLRLKKELEAIFGTRSIVIEEDVKLAGLYNIKRTYALHSRCAFYAYIDEGVGGSIIRNGEIELGAHAFAGDFGQMRDMDGVTVEEKICVPRFLSCFGQRRASFQTWETIRVQLERGGSEPCKIYDELVKNTVMALNNICWLVDPDYIIIESPYCDYIPGFLVTVEEKLNMLLGNLRKGGGPKLIAAGSTEYSAHQMAALLVEKKFLENL